MHRSTRSRLAIAAAATIVSSAAFAWSRTASDSSPAPPPPPDAAAGVLEDTLPEAGMVPIETQVRFWSDRVEANPSDYLSRTQLGRSLLDQAKADADPDLYREAAMAFDEALALNPRYSTALLGSAATRAAEHDFAGALEIAQQVHDLAPEDLGALAAVADYQLELGDYDAARRGYAELATRAGERSAPIASREARLAWLSGDADGAVELASEARALAADVGLTPGDLAFYEFQVATYRYGAGELDAAAHPHRPGPDRRGDRRLRGPGRRRGSGRPPRRARQALREHRPPRRRGGTGRARPRCR
jgi:tetratricopeptide (TPR) repeat protein